MIELTTKLSKIDRNILSDTLVGWHVLHPYLMRLNISVETLETLRKLLTLEIETQCREQVVKRLVGRIRTVRHLLEEQHLYGLMGGKVVMSVPRVKKKKKKKPVKKDKLPSIKSTAEMVLASGE